MQFITTRYGGSHFSKQKLQDNHQNIKFAGIPTNFWKFSCLHENNVLSVPLRSINLSQHILCVYELNRLLPGLPTKTTVIITLDFQNSSWFKTKLLSHFEHGCDVIMRLYMRTSFSTAHFCSRAHSFPRTDNSACISVLPNIRYAVTPRPF